MRALPRRTGKSHYIANSDGRVWGFEDWAVTTAADGMRVLQAYCELDFGGEHVTRQITQSVRADWRPHDGHVRTMVDGRFGGSAWYRFSETEVECEAFTAQEGRFAQRFPVGPRVRGLGTHALQADAWNAAVLDFSKGPHHEAFSGNIMISLHHFGATGPKIETTNSGLQYFGDEDVDVPAGKFRCHKVAYAGMTANDHPPYVMWISADGAFTFVKGEVAGYMASRFELVEYAEHGLSGGGK